MDLTAKNILCDEYPDAEECITQIDKDGKLWAFSTDVYQLIAPARFYIGLAEHITITNAEELKKYVSEYISKYFS